MSALQWHEADLHLVNTRLHPGNSEPMLSVWEALLKEASRNLPLQALFRPAGIYNVERPWRIRIGAHYRARVLLFGASDENALVFAERLRDYLLEGERNFALAEELNFTHTSFQGGAPPQCADIGLEFFTPLYFKHCGRRATQIQFSQLLQALRSRCQRLFSAAVPNNLAPDADAATPALLPWGLRYQRLMHRSRSQAGTMQWLDGFVGQLVIGDGWRPYWPLLQLAAAIGAGGRVAFGQGHCQLHLPAKPLLGQPFSVASLQRATEQVLERHDDVAITLAAETTIPFSAPAFAQQLATRLQNEAPPEWRPNDAFRICKDESSQRLVEQPGPVELVVNYTLLAACTPVFERMFEPQSFGFRPGRSRQQAAEAIEEAIRDGFAFVLESDVAACFPSIDHDVLEQRLRASLSAADGDAITVLMSLVRNPYRIDDVIHQRSRGLAQGAPLSPSLANIVLDCFDERFNKQGQSEHLRLVRYADDFVLLTKTRDMAEQLWREIALALQAIGLEPAAEKTRIATVADGFDFLGMHFDGSGKQASEAALVKVQHKPLYITEPGVYLGLSGEALQVRRDGKLLMTRPVARLSEVILLAPASLSSLLLARLQQQGVCLTLGSQGGRHHGAVMPDSRTFLARSHVQAVFYERMGNLAKLEMARDLVRCKIANQCAVLKQRYQSGDAECMAALDKLGEQVEGAPDLPTIRGFEGKAAHVFFQRLCAEIKDADFAYRKRLRGRRPGEVVDRLNALLNFGYFLLFSRINASLRAQGLNPYLGFVHETSERFETLAADIQELFRPHIDRLVVRLINLKVIRSEHFVDQGDRGMRLDRDGIRLFVQHVETELLRSPKNNGLSLSEAITAQILSIRGWMCEGKNLALYRLGID
ncbi:CRISPR-associated endonuclease Cas1 [bacterium]|nr:CRISPR-associated endonuclease Cas1 [bacterium]